MAKDNNVPEGYTVVFSRYITLKNGKRVYPKNGKVFRFVVPVKR